MPTFAPSAVVPQLVATSALTQLNRQAVFARAAVGDYEPVALQKGDTVTVRRARLISAQDYDPRSGTPATQTEPGYFSAQLALERLWTNGFPVYGNDNNDSISRYVPEYGEQIGAAIALSNDDYHYSKFRTLAIASSGAVAYGAQPPVAIVASQSAGAFTDFNKSVLINATVVLQNNNVPANNRYAILSSAAGGSFLGDSVLTEGFVAASVGSGQQLISGIAPGMFVPRYGFNVSSSNAVGSQSGATTTTSISSATASTAFTVADYAATTYLGAVDVTIGSVIAGTAVGAIAKLAPASGDTIAYGLILRVAGSVVTLVPFSPKGLKLVATDIVAGTHLFSIPTIPSISVAYHREALLFAVRDLAKPSDGSGATMFKQSDPISGLSVQVLTGQYKIDQFQESQRYAMLTGALLSDHRKAVLMLSL
jgi:hypothetical protein